MGHHISKQQNQQWSDEDQRMNHTRVRLEPPTSTNHIKSAQKIKTKKHSKQPTDAKIGSDQKDKTPKRSVNNTTLTKNQECGAGSVVITIRLLKMESTIKDIETITNMNATLQSDGLVHLLPTTDNNSEKRKICDDFKRMNINEGDPNASHMALNTSNIPNNDNDKHLNNNSLCDSNSSEGDDKKTTNSTIDSLNVENSDYLSMFNETNDMMNENNSFATVKWNRINSHSEQLNCDTVSANGSSLFSRSDNPMPSHSELGVDSVGEEICDIALPSPSSSTSSPTSTSTSTSTSQQTAIITEPSISQKILRDLFPTGLVSTTVSPYPHHIPIANIVKSECNNGGGGGHSNEHSAHCHHPKTNCFNKQTTTTTAAAAAAANKDAKEPKTKKPNWSIKLNCTKLKGSGSSPSATTETNKSNTDTASTTNSSGANRSKEATSQAATLVLDKPTVFSTNGGNVFVVTMDQRQLDLARLAPNEYAIDEDCDKKARIQRAIEIAEGVEPPPGFISTNTLKSWHSMATPNVQLVPNAVVHSTNDKNGNNAGAKIDGQQWHMLCSNTQTLRFINNINHLLQSTDEIPIPRIHSQVDYIHCLVPDLKQITNCSFYWGKMDRYEAERLLENKPEGTFLLRDSVQEEYMFSVSFQKYGRSLHARIEQFNHLFSFDVHDPGVYTAKTVTGLLEHYKDPACVMFFEPALTLPLNRKFVFSLQQLCRATIVSQTSYDGINEICLPKQLKSYLKEYHYKQRVKVRRFDELNYGAT